MRWVDNSVVTMVSTFHTEDETALRMRRKPRPTSVNKAAIEQVWGNDHTVPVCIPSVIDDYNHWMLGVDRCDQLISNYRNNLRCRGTWMPLMFHAIDIMQVNAFICYNALNHKDLQLDHKDFILSCVENLLERASTFNRRKTRSTHSKKNSNRSTKETSTKRKRMYYKLPKIPNERFQGLLIDHVCTQASKKRKCKYCSYLRLKHKARNLPGPVPKISKVYKKCAKCDVWLCRNHFKKYHMEIESVIGDDGDESGVCFGRVVEL